jgi:2,3,4,5-tetrahydropyridine-2,6-dicarboxylate N-succinyltransferase
MSGTVQTAEAVVARSASRPEVGALAASDLLAALAAGAVRAAGPDPDAPDGWRVRLDVKAAILATFADRTSETWDAGPLRFRDRAVLAPIGPTDDQRIVPGGTAIRAGAHLEPCVIVMPPSYVNVGAWVGRDTMVDSHVLVGSCAQIGARVHLAAGVTIGGVLEPAGARPVIVEDDAFVGAGSILLEGVLVRRGAVIGAGTVLTGTSRLYDVDGERELVGSLEQPLVVPEGAVVVPGTRPVAGAWARELGLAVATALIVKRRDAGTSARVALETALRV